MINSRNKIKSLLRDISNLNKALHHKDSPERARLEEAFLHDVDTLENANTALKALAGEISQEKERMEDIYARLQLCIKSGIPNETRH